MKQKPPFYFNRWSHSLHPAKQIRADPRIIIRRGGNQLDHRSTLLLNHLLAKIVDKEEVVEEDEPQVDCHVLPNEEEVILEQAEPFLIVDEEEVQELVEEEEQQQHILPYQRTHFYQQQRNNNMKELCLLQRMNKGTYLAMAIIMLSMVTETIYYSYYTSRNLHM